MLNNYLFVVSSVNQLVITRSLITSLKLKGTFNVVIFGSRGIDEISKMAKFAEQNHFIIKDTLWLSSLSFSDITQRLKSLSNQHYNEAFFFSYYTYYSLFMALLKNKNVPCSIAEEGLGTYRAGIEKQVAPLPLGLSIKKNQQHGLFAIPWILADWLNQRCTKSFLVATAKLIPFPIGAYLSRPTKVHRIICHYPDLMRPYFKADEYIKLRFDDRVLRIANKAYLDRLQLRNKSVVIFASQPIIWQIFETADEMRSFLLQLLDNSIDQLLFAPHPRDETTKLADLKALVADDIRLIYLDAPEEQDLETTVNYIQPQKLIGLSSSTLLYCSQKTECSSVLNQIPTNKISTEANYHDLIYRWIKSQPPERNA